MLWDWWINIRNIYNTVNYSPPTYIFNFALYKLFRIKLLYINLSKNIKYY